MHILIIDDDEDLHFFLTVYLESEGFTVYSAHIGGRGIRIVERRDLDLVILDILLPDMKGWEVCRQIRTLSSAPVIMVSAIAQENKDIVHGLTVGADDYITKPLHLEVLLARIQALLRRSTNLNWYQSRPSYTDHHLVVELYHRQVQVNGQSILLPPLEPQLLEILVRNINQTVTTLEIVEELWSGADTDNLIDHVYVYIGRLRKKIEPNPHDPCYIVTEYGVGYCFRSQV